MKKENLFVIVCLAVFILSAFLIRMPMINYGLPYLFHPDEYAISNETTENIKFMRLDTHYYLYPIYSVYFYTAVDYAFWKAGSYFWPDQIPKSRKNLEPKVFYQVNRTVSVLLAVLCVIAVFVLGKVYSNIYTGLASAALLCFSPAHLQNSWIIKPDSGMLLFSIIALIFYYKSLKIPSLLNLTFSFLLTAAAILFKLNAFCLIIPAFFLAGFLWEESRANIIKALLITFAVVAVTILPVIGKIGTMISKPLKAYISYQTAEGSKFPNLYFFKYYFAGGLGIITATACFGALLYGTIKIDRRNIFIYWYVWAYLIVLLFVKRDLDQHALLIVPALYLICADTLQALTVKIKYLFPVLIGIFVISGAPLLADYINIHMMKDSRISAREWVEKSIKPDEPVLYEVNGPPMCDFDPPLDGNPSLVLKNMNITYMNRMIDKNDIIGCEYYILSRYTKYEGELSSEGIVVKKFEAKGLGPEIKIYKKKYVFRPEFSDKTIVPFGDTSKKWYYINRVRPIYPAIEYENNGILMSFVDTERKDAYHYFLQQSDLNTFFGWEKLIDDDSFLITRLKWDSNARLSICTIGENGNTILIEGKRGLDRETELILHVPKGKISGFMFYLSTPHMLQETNKRIFLHIYKSYIGKL